MHRPFRIFSNFEKIFTEIGDTALQSWTNFGNFRKIQDPSTDFQWKSSRKCSDEDFHDFLMCVLFFTRDIRAQGSGALHIWYLLSYIQILVSFFCFFWNFCVFLIFCQYFWSRVFRKTCESHSITKCDTIFATDFLKIIEKPIQKSKFPKTHLFDVRVCT